MTEGRLKVITGEIQHLNGIKDLDRKLYPDEWHTENNFGLKVLNKNSELYRILLKDDVAVGYYIFLPLNNEGFNGVLKGLISENNLYEYILDYNDSKECYLYMLSMVVDVFHERKNEFTKILLKDIYEHLTYIQSKGILIKKVGAIPISEGGYRITNRMGIVERNGSFNYNKLYESFTTSADNLIGNIDLNYINKKI